MVFKNPLPEHQLDSMSVCLMGQFGRIVNTIHVDHSFTGLRVRGSGNEAPPLTFSWVPSFFSQSLRGHRFENNAIFDLRSSKPEANSPYKSRPWLLSAGSILHTVNGAVKSFCTWGGCPLYCAERLLLDSDSKTEIDSCLVTTSLPGTIKQ